MTAGLAALHLGSPETLLALTEQSLRIESDPAAKLSAAGALIQSSHAVYYAFGTIHWQAAGHSEAVIGWLWAEGVIAETVLAAASIVSKSASMVRRAAGLGTSRTSRLT